jgi:hypothetical protein
MDVHELLVELFGRVREHVHEVVDGLDAEQLTWAPAGGTNPIGWLVWHLTRVQDHHLSELVEQEQEWIGGGWASRFGVDADPHNTGYGHTADDVARIRPESADALVGYYDAVADRMDTYLAGIRADDLDRIVDRRWDPPVTLGVRLVSIADDDIQHAGQAAYARGLLERG